MLGKGSEISVSPGVQTSQLRLLRILCVVACAVLIPLTAHSQPVIDIDDTNSTVSTDVTWPAGAEVNVHSGVFVSSMASLTVERGVRVCFDAETYISVQGGFEVAGSEDEPVLFTSANPRPAAGDWLGIFCFAPSRPPSISHAVVEYTARGVQIGMTSPILEHTVIRDVAGGSGVYFRGTESSARDDAITIRHCVIERVQSIKGTDGARGGNGSAGADGWDSLIPDIPGGPGGSGARGGDGGSGGPGGDVAGVTVNEARAVIEHTVIRDIAGGEGGTGGGGGRGGRGGEGGNGFSALIGGSNGGDGGDGGSNGDGGQGGRGGQAWGVRVDFNSRLSLSTSLITRITGGRGGEGGSADLGGSRGGNGGNGGDGIGVFAHGGDGGDGGDGGSRGTGGRGGPGGIAHAIHAPSASNLGRIEFNTISDIRRGPEGKGGVVSGTIGQGGSGGARGTGGPQGSDGTNGQSGAPGDRGADGAIGIPGTSFGLLVQVAVGEFELSNNILAFGDTDGGAGVSVPALDTLSHDYNCIFGFQSAYIGTSPAPHEIFINPGFAESGNGNYRLRPDSPCIDAASPSVDTGLLDLDGEVRPYDVPGVGFDGPGQGFDIGCFEYAPFKEDLNLDGLLNWKDLFTMSREWWMDPAPKADLDGDGKVDGEDIRVMMRKWLREATRR